jgi:hypothetical protein
LALKGDGRTLRYEAPGGIDTALKAELLAHKAELIGLLAEADPYNLGSAPVAGEVADPNHHAHAEESRPSGWSFYSYLTPRDPTTIIVVRDGEREVTHLPPGVPVPAEAVLWTQPGTLAHWWPGPAHALFGEASNT